LYTQPSTLRAIGTHVNIWVANDCYDNSSTTTADNKITTAQAQNIAVKFDMLYPIETAVFGYETGAGSGAKVQILINDLIGSAGTYAPADEDSELSPSGLIVIKVLRADAATDDQKYALYLTVAHEFQHMINFNAKGSTESWYNEMLSVMAEQLVAPFLGMSDSAFIGHALWPCLVFGALQEYPDGLLSGNYNIYGAFGAYLVRNFGGWDLIKEILSNNTDGEASISLALASTVNPLRSEVSSFESALRRYGEALIYTNTSGGGTDTLSFNKTVTTTIGGYTFTCPGVNVWERRDGWDLRPTIYSANNFYDMPCYSLRIHSLPEWQNISGSLTIQLQKPTDPNVEFYLMVR
jgi:hypothetical protein